MFPQSENSNFFFQYSSQMRQKVFRNKKSEVKHRPENLNNAQIFLQAMSVTLGYFCCADSFSEANDVHVPCIMHIEYLNIVVL